MRASDDFHHHQLVTQYDANRLGFVYGLARGGGGGGAPQQPAQQAAPAEKPAAQAKTSFDIKLDGYDDSKKVFVIKEVRALTNLGLKEVG